MANANTSLSPPIPRKRQNISPRCTSPAPSRKTIRKAVAEYIEAKENILSPSTIEGYRNIERNRLKRIAAVEIADFDTAAAQRYINELSRRLSPKSVANAWGLVTSAIKMQEPEKVLAVTLPKEKANA